MAQSAPLILRLVASSITAVNRAGKIIRDVMSEGDLGIVEKVGMRLYVVSTHIASIR
jgi:3'(2'), 5'-bisphosphate nucleotidase